MDRRNLPGTELELSPFGVAVGEEPSSSIAPAPDQPSWIELRLEITSAQWQDVSERFAPSAPPPLLVRVPPVNWDRSMLAACRDLLARTHRACIDIWQLDPFDLERIKAGEPFRRMIALRDEGLIRWFSIRVGTIKDATWCIEHAPVHVITLDVPLESSEADELFALAEEMGIGLLGTARAASGDPARARSLAASTPLVSFAWPAVLCDTGVPPV